MMDKDKIKKIVLECMSDITGLDAQSIEKIKDKNLIKIGMLNSLSLMTLTNMIESELNIKFDIKKCKLSDFESIDSIVNVSASLLME